MVDALTEISTAIGMVSELVGGGTREISSNMQNAAQGVACINDQIGKIASTS